MDTVKDMMLQLERISGLVADAIIRKTRPFEDDISENQAMKEYGERWLRRMKKDGLAKFNRIGNRNVYSRHQLNCLREAEREHARLVFKVAGKVSTG